MSPDTSSAAPLQLGQQLRDFKFSTYNPVTKRFEDHTLFQFLLEGKWVVLYFYPSDFTFVCPTELSDLAHYQEQLKEIGVEVISMSTDTKFSHLAWHNAEKLLKDVRFLMGSDPTGEIASLFGVYDATIGATFRGTFIINPKAMLVGSEVNYYNVGRSASELYRKMRAYTYLHERPEQACPAAWEEGQTVLTPSEKLVGRVSDFV